MDVAWALAELERKGKESTRKTYARHGVRGPCFGVSYADLAVIHRKLNKSQALALALWASGNHDARILATKLVDPARLDDETAFAWIGAADNYVVTEAIAGVIARMPSGASVARRLIDSEDEWPSAAGWTALGQLAASGAVDDGLAAQLLERIKSTIAGAPNRTRHAMNGAIIGVGAYRERLRDRALEVAQAVSPVMVDHGDTGCETPDAAAYIAKMVAHARKKKATAKKATAKKATAKKATAKKATAKQATAKKAARR